MDRGSGETWAVVKMGGRTVGRFGEVRDPRLAGSACGAVREPCRACRAYWPRRAPRGQNDLSVTSVFSVAEKIDGSAPFRAYCKIKEGGELFNPSHREGADSPSPLAPG